MELNIEFILVSLIMYFNYMILVYLYSRKKNTKHKKEKTNIKIVSKKHEELLKEECITLKEKQNEAELLIKKYMDLIKNHKKENIEKITSEEYKILIKRVHPDTAKNKDEVKILNKISAEFNERRK